MKSESPKNVLRILTLEKSNGFINTGRVGNQ